MKPRSYILKTGFHGFQNPPIILNCPQRDCLVFGFRIYFPGFRMYVPGFRMYVPGFRMYLPGFRMFIPGFRMYVPGF